MSNVQQSKNYETSVYKGGETAHFVRQMIYARWGLEAAEEYNPRKNCFTYRGWKERGFQVKRGEKAIPSWTYIEVLEKDSKTGDDEVVAVYKRNVNLFYKTQVKPANGN